MAENTQPSRRVTDAGERPISDCLVWAAYFALIPSAELPKYEAVFAARAKGGTWGQAGEAIGVSAERARNRWDLGMNIVRFARELDAELTRLPNVLDLSVWHLPVPTAIRNVFQAHLGGGAATLHELKRAFERNEFKDASNFGTAARQQLSRALEYVGAAPHFSAWLTAAAAPRRTMRP